MSTEQDAIKSLREQFEERFKRKSSQPPTIPVPPHPGIVSPPPPVQARPEIPALTSERLVTVTPPIGSRYGSAPPPARPVAPPLPVIEQIVTPVLRCEMCDEEVDELDAWGCCEMCASRTAEEWEETREEEDERADLAEDTIDGHLVPGSGWTDGQELEAVLATPAQLPIVPIVTPTIERLGPDNPTSSITERIAHVDPFAGQMGIAVASSAIQAYLSYLRGQFVERDEMIHAAVVAIIARQHAAYIGPAGSAKSQVIRYLMRGITGVTCASYQGNSFTTPDELIGQVSLHALERDDEYKRKLDGRMAAVELYELDEAFRLTNKAFNVLLRALNEREVFNPGATSIPLHSVMVASNDYPADPELRALRDRFAVKMFVDYVSAENFIKMMRLRQDVTPEVTVPWAAFLRLSHEAERLVDDERAIPERIMELLLELRTKLKEQNVTMSDRIMKWAKPLLVSCALLDGRTTVLPTDIWFLQHVLWDDAKDRAKVKSAIEALVGRLDTDLDEIAAMILSVGQAYTKSMNPGAGAPTLNPGQRINIRADATVKHDHMRDQLQLLAPSVPEEGALRDKYERISQALVTLRHEISAVGN